MLCRLCSVRPAVFECRASNAACACEAPTAERSKCVVNIAFNTSMSHHVGCRVRAQRRLFVVATTSNSSILDEMGLTDAFNVTMAVPMVSSPDQVLEVLSHSSAEVDPSAQRAMADMIKGPVGIKKLLLVLELAKQSGSVSLSTFRQACLISGVTTRRTDGSSDEAVGGAGGAPKSIPAWMAPKELGSPDADDDE